MYVATHMSGVFNMAKQVIRNDSQIQKLINETTKTTAYPIEGYRGLELNVRVTVNKKVADFRHRYTHPITGKRPYMTLGTYPNLSLAKARETYQNNLTLLEQNLDPLEHRESKKQMERIKRANVVQVFIDEWKENQKAKHLNPRTYQEHRRLVAPIEKQFGQMPVENLKPSQVIAFIKEIQKERTSKGKNVLKRFKSILQLARARGVIEYNPCSDLQGIITPHKVKHRPALTTPKEFAKLLQEIEALPNAEKDRFFKKEVLQLLALLFMRIGDICAMRWADIDWETCQWEFKPKKSGDREDMMNQVVVPLAPQAIQILKQMHTLTGHAEYVFYNARRTIKGELYVDQQLINDLLNSKKMNDGKSYKGIHCPHGFRASAKTMLMEQLDYDELITELQIGHKMLNKYGKAYSRMTMLDQRRDMMNEWANYLDDLREGNA